MTNDLVEVFWAADAQSAHAVKAMLEDAGITAQVVGEMLQGAIGELPMGPVTSPRVWVLQQDEARARELVAAWEKECGSAPKGTAWTCSRCGAEVDAGFDLCWKCQAPREADTPR